jgi:SAM-dependent methyltransferase
MSVAPVACPDWTHNRHYWSVVLEAIPPGCESALDVGCGIGELTRELSDVIPRVIGIDRDPRSIDLARGHPAAGGIEYITGDLLSTRFKAQAFGLITAVASLHHMDAAAALSRMRDLLAPGGVLAVVGVARDSMPLDIALNVPAFVGHRMHRFGRGRWDAVDRRVGEAYRPPVVPAPATYRQLRRLAVEVLPGVRYRRHLYWRYSLVWTKPAG